MKKILLLFALLPILTAAGFAQESRQDVSVSVGGIFPVSISQNAVQQTATNGLQGLVSYRYMLTPRNAVEANFGYTQISQKYVTTFDCCWRVHDRMVEFSGAYVFNLNFKNWNPFLEGGPAAFLHQPLDDASTTYQAFKQEMDLGLIYGGGVAYELSPSFDLRLEYRGLVMETPDFGFSTVKVNRFYNLSNPVFGIAYHF
jgi:opacity protein-like surface antigen